MWLLCCAVLCIIFDLQIDPGELLQSMARHLQQAREEAEEGGREQGCSGGSLVVKEVVTETRVPVLKLLDTQSELEVRSRHADVDTPLGCSVLCSCITSLLRLMFPFVFSFFSIMLCTASLMCRSTFA